MEWYVQNFDTPVIDYWAVERPGRLKRSEDTGSPIREESTVSEFLEKTGVLDLFGKRDSIGLKAVQSAVINPWGFVGFQELTLLDSLEYQRVLYEVPAGESRRSLDELCELLELGPLLERQLRALSLGERTRAGLALSLLYRPKVLFLDEPTLGLDVSAAVAIRRFLASYATQTAATILLTSHYMADVESLCRRLVLIDHGSLTYDGPLDQLSARLSPGKLIKVSAPDATKRGFAGLGELVSTNGVSWELRVPRDEVAQVAARLLSTLDVVDLAIEEPSLEDVIDAAYREGV